MPVCFFHPLLYSCTRKRAARHRARFHGMTTWLIDFAVIAGFFTGGALAVRGGVKAARNSAIMCAVFLAVIEGVGIGFQRMMADNTKLEVRINSGFVVPGHGLASGLFGTRIKTPGLFLGKVYQELTSMISSTFSSLLLPRPPRRPSLN